ncbi:MAG: IS110 family transposase [Candidatus Omnitrophota bacterium]
MRFYKPYSKFYCGIDVHSRIIYLCIIGADKKVIVHRKLKNLETDKLLAILKPYRKNIVVVCESTFAWYWLSDFCTEHGFEFILGHPYYMKAISGSKVKNDKIDSEKIARLTQSGMFPLAYACSKEKRSLRDLLRRRLYFVEIRAKLIAHIQILNYQANKDSLGRISNVTAKRIDLYERFDDEAVKRSVDANLKTIDFYNKTISDLEVYIRAQARAFNRKELSILQSINGIGDIIALTILYEVDDINRFESVQKFSSYCRLVRCAHESAGKRYGAGGKKMGNVYLKRVFSEAAIFVTKFNPKIEKYYKKLESKKGKMKAYSILAHKIATVVYYMLKSGKVFDIDRFLAH